MGLPQDVFCSGSAAPNPRWDSRQQRKAILWWSNWTRPPPSARSVTMEKPQRQLARETERKGATSQCGRKELDGNMMWPIIAPARRKTRHGRSSSVNFRSPVWWWERTLKTTNEPFNLLGEKLHGVTPSWWKMGKHQKVDKRASVRRITAELLSSLSTGISGRPKQLLRFRRNNQLS